MTTQTKQRSPNYPSVDLATSIADIKTLYQKNGRSRIGLEPAAKALGYKSLSGPSRSRIAAIRHFGLLEMGGGLVTPSDRGLVIAMRSPESAEYQAAVREAAMTPEIFRELFQTHLQASEDALRHYLVAVKRFSPEGAKRLAETFKNTMRLVGLEEESYDQDMAQASGLMQSLDQSEAEVSRARTRGGTSVAESQMFSWPLSESRTVKVAFEGGLDGEEDLDTLMDYLEVVRKTLKRQKLKQGQEQENEGP